MIAAKVPRVVWLTPKYLQNILFHDLGKLEFYPMGSPRVFTTSVRTDHLAHIIRIGKSIVPRHRIPEGRHAHVVSSA